MYGEQYCYNAECPFASSTPSKCACYTLCNGYVAFAPKVVASNRTEMREEGMCSNHTKKGKGRE